MNLVVFELRYLWFSVFKFSHVEFPAGQCGGSPPVIDGSVCAEGRVWEAAGCSPFYCSSVLSCGPRPLPWTTSPNCGRSGSAGADPRCPPASAATASPPHPSLQTICGLCGFGALSEHLYKEAICCLPLNFYSQCFLSYVLYNFFCICQKFNHVIT